MTRTTSTLSILMLTTALSAPAVAQMAGDEMSCAEFVALDAGAQMEAMETMSHDDMMAEGEMEAEGEMMAEGEMGSEGEMMAEGETEAEGEMMAEGEMTVDSLVAFCNEHPDMTVGTAMMEMDAM